MTKQRSVEQKHGQRTKQGQAVPTLAAASFCLTVYPVQLDHGITAFLRVRHEKMSDMRLRMLDPTLTVLVTARAPRLSPTGTTPVGDEASPLPSGVINGPPKVLHSRLRNTIPGLYAAELVLARLLYS